jgi:hypothetical protein
VLAAILVGGWFVADGLTAAKASTSADSLVLETTVNKLITVREKGKLVTKVVPVVKRVVRIRSHTQTQVERETDLRYSTRVLTEPGGVRVVRRVVTTTTRVPVVKNHVVTVNGKTKRVAVTSYVPTTRVETQTQTQTQTETRQQTVTQSAAPNTITQVSTANHTTTDVQTQTQTQTVTTVQTATVTTTNVVTEVQTVTNTVTDTQTVTEPPVTITITLPSP